MNLRTDFPPNKRQQADGAALRASLRQTREALSGGSQERRTFLPAGVHPADPRHSEARGSAPFQESRMLIPDQSADSSVERAWNLLLERSDLAPELRQMTGAAAKRPALGSLFPYLSLETRLRFGHRTEYPYSGGYPWLAYIDSQRVLDGPAFELRAADSAPIARGAPAHLLNLLVESLPAREHEATNGDGDD